MRRRSRTILLLAILLAGLVASGHLGLEAPTSWPDAARWSVLGRFLKAAVTPTLMSESAELPISILPRTLRAMRDTVIFAAAAMSIAVVVGAILGVLASERWWRLFPATRRFRPLFYGSARALIAFMRSIHEIIWALALQSAFGLNTVAAVIAIAIPYGGTLAKVFSEMLDEAPDDSATALRMVGAGSLQTFTFGLVPRALPDMGAYAFYRFECALRSAAVLGFFGFPTLGLYIHEACGEFYFHEAWTYLYALFLLIVIVEWWSGALRRRLTVA